MWTGWELSALVGGGVFVSCIAWLVFDALEGRAHDRRIKALGLQFARERDERVEAARRIRQKKF